MHERKKAIELTCSIVKQKTKTVNGLCGLWLWYYSIVQHEWHIEMRSKPLEEWTQLCLLLVMESLFFKFILWSVAGKEEKDTSSKSNKYA